MLRQVFILLIKIVCLPSTLFSTDSSDNVVAVYDKQADNDSDHSQPLDNDVGHDDIHVGNDRDRQFDLPVRHDSPDVVDIGVDLPAHGHITLIDEADPPLDEDETDILTQACPSTDKQNSPSGFFNQFKNNVGIVVKKQPKKRKYLSHITSGKAITEDDVMADIVAHCQKQEYTS